MFVILITANFKFRNRSTCSKGPMKRAGKVCGDFHDLKSPGSYHLIPLNSLNDNVTDMDDDSDLVADVDPETLIRDGYILN